MRSIISIIMLTIPLLVSNTQSGFTQERISGGSGSFHLGHKFYNTQNFSYFLEDGVSDLKNNLLIIGGGGYAIYNNFIVGGRGFYQGGNSKDVTLNITGNTFRDFTYSFNGGGGYLNLGYVVHSTKNVLLFPQLGIGYEGIVLEKALNERTSFEPREALSTEYRWGSPMLDIGAGIDWFLSKDRGYKIGLRIGYTISLQRNSNWSHSGGNFIDTDLPTNNLDALYINLSIGGGWFSNTR